MPLLLGGELEVGVGVLLLWSLPAAENWDTKERTVETEIKIPWSAHAWGRTE